MKYQKLVKIHVFLVTFFASFFFVIPLTGGLYLLGIKGETVRYELKTLPAIENFDQSFIEKLLRSNDLNYHFEYIKDAGKLKILRPSHREHLEIITEDDKSTIVLVQPNFLAGFIEIHKGHGPSLMKKTQIIFVMAFFLVMLSGTLIYWKKKHDLKALVLTKILGLTTFLFLYFFY